MVKLDRNLDTPGRWRRPTMLPSQRPTNERDESEVRWLMSYSDFMMQLVCLFILLYSVSSIDTSKAIPLAQAWREEAGVGEARVPEGPRTPHVPLTSADLPAILRELYLRAGRYPAGASLRIFREADGIRLQFPCEMFERGSATLGIRGKQVSDLAAVLLRPLEPAVLSIELVGHASADEADAVGLSLGRAAETLRYLARPGAPEPLAADALLASGRGAAQPAADNAASAGRAANRRVEFVIRLARRS